MIFFKKNSLILPYKFIVSPTHYIMETKKYAVNMSMTIEAAILAVGLVVLGLCLKSGINSIVNKDRQVTVKGLAEKEVPADKIIWPIVYKEVGNDLPTLYAAINKKSEIIKTFLTSNGVKEDEISVNAPQLYDNTAERYGNENQKYRYLCSSVITVTSNNVNQVHELIARQGELLNQGVAIIADNYENKVRYELSSFKDMKPQMMDEAIKKAQETAEQFAKSMNNCKLDKIISANQGSFSISDRDENTPYIKNVRVVSTITYSLK